MQPESPESVKPEPVKSAKATAPMQHPGWVRWQKTLEGVSLAFSGVVIKKGEVARLEPEQAEHACAGKDPLAVAMTDGEVAAYLAALPQHKEMAKAAEAEKRAAKAADGKE